MSSSVVGVVPEVRAKRGAAAGIERHVGAMRGEVEHSVTHHRGVRNDGGTVAAVTNPSMRAPLKRTGAAVLFLAISSCRILGSQTGQ